MGKSINADSRAPIREFYSATSWIEGAAQDQLIQVASLPDVIAVAAMPDLCPGQYGPVGVAILASEIHPDFVGSDIGCGMALFVLDGKARKLRLDKAAEKLRVLDDVWNGAPEARLAESGLSSCGFADSLGTIGGGNHFCEIQMAADKTSAAALEEVGLSSESVYLLVHSGSRGLGHSILTDAIKDGLSSLDPLSPAGLAYRDSHDKAISWASLNRQVIAERAATALGMEAQLVVDAPHNLLDDYDGHILHRKGAARVTGPGALLPLAGSRGDLSRLVRWTGNPNAMMTIAHGSGRRFDRASSRRRFGGEKSKLEALRRNKFGGYVICENKNLLCEEAPAAYKDSASVMTDLTQHGLAEEVAAFKPLVTFKTTMGDRR